MGVKKQPNSARKDHSLPLFSLNGDSVDDQGLDQTKVNMLFNRRFA